MHELGIAQTLLETVLATARQEGSSRVHSVSLRIGELTGIVPEALEFAFTTLRDRTPAAEARLEMELIPARYVCTRCGTGFDRTTAACAACGTAEGRLVQGRELQVVAVELE